MNHFLSRITHCIEFLIIFHLAFLLGPALPALALAPDAFEPDSHGTHFAGTIAIFRQVGKF